MAGKRALVAAVVAVAGPVLAVLAWVGPAAAGFLSPVADRYEPGDEATLVGYVTPPPPGWEAEGPYMAFFKEVGPLSSQVRIGPLNVAEVDTPAGPSLRVSLVFRIPPDAAPGQYEVTYCDRACTGGLGDLAGSHPLNVGVAPAGPIVREWARNEPQIANLAPEAVVAGPNFRAPAADLRAQATSSSTTIALPPAVATTVPIPAPLPTVALEPPTAATSPAAGVTEGNGWFVVLGITLALACTAAVLVAMRPPPARVPVRA